MSAREQHGCAIPGCGRSMYFTGLEGKEYMTSMGWLETAEGWVCPTHVRAIAVVKNIWELLRR